MIDYFAEGASSASIWIIGSNNGISNTYPINQAITQKVINIDNYPTGIYAVMLLCDGIYYSPTNLSVY